MNYSFYSQKAIDGGGIVHEEDYFASRCSITEQEKRAQREERLALDPSGEMAGAIYC